MQARLRAQLGDRPKYSGERRRRSVVVASMVLTITDPLRGSYPLLCYLQAALIRSCGASFACMELTTISRFQRLQASTKSLLHSLFLWFFSALEVSKALKKSAGGAILPFFLLITYGHSQLSTIGGECFFVADGVRAFGGEALAQVVDFVVVLLKKKGGFFV